MYYIQKDDKHRKIIKYIYKVFNIVKLEDNKIIIPDIKELRNDEKNMINIKKKREKQMRKLAQVTIKLLEKSNSKKLIISKELKKEKEYINYLNSYSIEIIDGKWLFGILMLETLEYIINLKKLNKTDIDISILVNDITNITIENIKKIASKFKKVSIISNHNEKLKKLQKEMEEEGIILTLINNKRKSIIKTDIILNIDFPEELLNKYSIYEEAIIINFSDKVNINKKRFNGIIINDYEINIKKEKLEELVSFDIEKINKYHIKDIYEAQIYKKQKYNIISDKIKKDEIKIKCLIGNNTIY